MLSKSMALFTGIISVLAIFTTVYATREQLIKAARSPESLADLCGTSIFYQYLPILKNANGDYRAVLDALKPALTLDLKNKLVTMAANMLGHPQTQPGKHELPQEEYDACLLSLRSVFPQAPPGQ